MRTAHLRINPVLAAAVAIAGALACASPVCLADGKSHDKARDKKTGPVKVEPVPEIHVQVVQEPTPAAPQRPNGSLWTNGSRSLVGDLRAHQVGDLVTIVVQESATASSTASTKSSRSDSAGFGGGTGLLRRFLKDFGASAQSSSDGQGTTSRSGSLDTRLTAVVKEVLPNGNLVLEGSRLVTINKENQKIVLTGTVRATDVAPDNTVSSIQLADASIKFDGKGTVGDHQRKGLIGRLFDWIF